MSSVESENRLRSLLPSLLVIVPSVKDSPTRLLSLARIYAVLYRLVTVEGLDAELGSRRMYTQLGDRLFRVLLRKARRTEDAVHRAALVSTSFYLTCETTLAYDSKRDNTCREAVIDLLSAHEESLTNPYVLRCLTDFFYPMAEADETNPWLVSLKDTIRHWAEAFSEEGSGPGISADEALARIETMNRNSYMLLDEAYDPVIRKAYAHYRSSMPLYNASLTTLSRLYDLAMQGNAYPVDRATASQVTNIMSDRMELYPEGSDESLLCLSHEVDSLCETILYMSQMEMLKIKNI